jgi:TIR domain
MTIPVRIFVSYAERDRNLAESFLELLRRHFDAAKRTTATAWDFHQLLVGDRWHERIQAEIQQAQFGLLLISPAFLTSRYILEHELRHFVGEGAKPVLPVGLVPVDFERHDLKGLEAHQIFRLDRRFCSELRGARRQAFALALFQQIDDRLVRDLATHGVKP